MDNNFDQENMKDLCSYCFDVLIAKLKKETLPTLIEKHAKEKFPLFVTWKKGKNLDLRGCIGTFHSSELGENLEKYAIISSLEDSRFKPVKLEEVSDLTVAVSILTNFEEVSDYNDWEVGKHGIQIKFKIKSVHHGATYLPEVALEQNWDKETALKSLIQKSGYYGNYSEALSHIKLTRYQSIKEHMSYEEYIQHKKQVEK